MSRKHTKKHLSFYLRFILALFLMSLVLGFGVYAKNASTTVYTGTLPCADCVGIKTTLTLYGNKTYDLQLVYIDKGGPYDEKGTWQQEEKNTMHVYALTNNSNTSYYEIVNGNTLKMLDASGHPINAPFNTTLKKQ